MYALHADVSRPNVYAKYIAGNEAGILLASLLAKLCSEFELLSRGEHCAADIIYGHLLGAIICLSGHPV